MTICRDVKLKKKSSPTQGEQIKRKNRRYWFTFYWRATLEGHNSSAATKMSIHWKVLKQNSSVHSCSCEACRGTAQATLAGAYATSQVPCFLPWALVKSCYMGFTEQAGGCHSTQVGNLAIPSLLPLSYFLLGKKKKKSLCQVYLFRQKNKSVIYKHSTNTSQLWHALSVCIKTAAVVIVMVLSKEWDKQLLVPGNSYLSRP